MNEMKSRKRSVLSIEMLENRLQPGSIMLSPPGLSLWEPIASETTASSSRMRNLLDNLQSQNAAHTGAGRSIDFHSDASMVALVQTTTPAVQPAAQDASQILTVLAQLPPAGQSPQTVIVDQTSAMQRNSVAPTQIASIPAIAMNDAAPANPDAAVVRAISGDQIRVQPISTELQNDGITTQSIEVIYGFSQGAAGNDSFADVATIDNGDGTYDAVYVGSVADDSGNPLCLATRVGPTGADDLKWSRTYEIGGSSGPCNGVATDAAGNSYIAGTIGGDAVMLKIDGAGDPVFAVALDGAAGLADFGNGIDVNAAGTDIAIVGAFGQASGDNNGFCIRLDGDGGLVSAGTEDPSGPRNLNGVSLDAATGKAYVAGNVTIDGQTQPLIRHYEADGTRVGGTRFLGAGNFQDVHFSGDAYMTGWIESGGKDNLFIAKFMAGDTTPDGIVYNFFFDFTDITSRGMGVRLENGGTYLNVAGSAVAAGDSNALLGLIDAMDPPTLLNFWLVGSPDANERANGLALDGLDDAYFGGAVDPGPAGGSDALGIKYRITPE